MTDAQLDAAEAAHWQAYVRRANGPIVEDVDEDLSQAETLLCPTDLPPPPTLPERDLTTIFSPYVVGTQDRRRVKVPWHVVIRDYTCKTRGIIADKNKNKVPDPCHVVVLMSRDAFGDAQYAWYLRLQSDPFLLRRMHYGAAEKLWTRLKEHEMLKLSSLNNTLLDAYFADPHLDFDALLSLRLESFRSRYSKACAPKKRRRKAKDEATAPTKKQKLQEEGETALINACLNGQCSVCLEEDVKVHPTSCCGTSGATCSTCRAKLRHYCPICSRKELCGSYQCLGCNKIVALKDYGMPCSSCDRCVLCSDCYKNVGECEECDLVRVPVF